jgi:PAS domain S-box-containing protein
MKRPSTRFFITLGLSSMLASALLLAMFVGLVPDRVDAERQGRAALSEALAASTSVFIEQGDLARIQATLAFVVERNDDLLSAGLRGNNGRLVASAGNHEQLWKPAVEALSTDAHVLVPIQSARGKWGTLELRFESLGVAGWMGPLFDPRVRMIASVVGLSFIAFHFYLGRVLRQLDPSRAVPARVRNALDTMAEGLLVLDPKGHVVLANEAFSRVVGRAADEIVGRLVTVFEFRDGDGAPLAVDDQPWNTALATGVTQRNFRLRLPNAGGELRTVLVNASPVMGAGTRPGGVLVSFDDVTELEEKEIQLRVAKNEAEAANRAKSDFLANMSHEIRTPMNAVLGFTELLRRGYHRDDAEMRRHLDTIHGSGTHLLELINDILDLAKVESGRMELERVPTAAHAIAQEVVAVLGVRAREKGIELRLECASPIPERVVTDPTRLRQIITNLVGNAIKFTAEGAVTVTLSADATRGDARLLIEVRDTGMGIPEDRIEAIFEPFTQASADTTRQHGGTGLGLTISRQFARGLGGDLTARSRVGVGSVFSATIETGPLDDVRWLSPVEALRTDAPAALGSGMTWSFPPAKVLVVDDGAPNRELVRLVLEPTGLQVEEAENGRIGVDKAMGGDFALILMDMQMPVMDGYEATQTLREHGCPTPVYAMTADAMKGFENRLLEAGCKGFVTKPIDMDVLLRTIAGLLGGTQVPVAETLMKPEAAPIAPPQPPPTKADPVRSRLHDHPKLKVVAQSFVDTLDSRKSAIRQAWEDRNYDSLASLGHWLKGTGGTAGFDVFTAPARSMEAAAHSRSEAELEVAIAELLDLADRVVGPMSADVQETAAHA